MPLDEIKTIVVTFNEGYRDDDGSTSVELVAEEFHTYEPAAYVNDPGWSCWHPPTDTEYYVNAAGVVWKQPGNIEVGIAPDIKAASDKMEAELAEVSDHDN